jgi:phage gp46-like protein
MSDLKMIFDDDSLLYDLNTKNGDIEKDDGLKTATILSLLTDRIIFDPASLPSPDDRRGYWGDTFQNTTGDFVGSQIWGLFRSKLSPTNTALLKERAADSLKWMITDGIASEVVVSIIAAPDPADFGIEIEIKKPTSPEFFKFALNWEAERISENGF